ncbi:exonuclease domain-containing protein [Flavilitoribacter nigricans]|uniref:DNA polymerase III subunit epsilon n=1 Tax=Flavilitoribacter nigricans (strain ATCC 23147 / DSM 23189 / NBRC 102662 / NCIMB 1420 / SS-2) TaxID=1122177 RepID=A0A2D0MYW8_FLAN2|nr:exonuclease domain-containing protein [Flavilitoribacter nigricans]PHN01417.1 DNA polymerase III subunit epsilon [Flavilitoribacter nigricans DSM 23189 = NBRC 102662]
MSKRYAIVDIETTGGRASRDKITEIAVVIHDGQRIIDSFESLVNPECYIPYGITQLTGITQEMVADAPKFYEIARKFVEITEGAVFVAHNVRFDYGFIREEFARLGYTYSRRQLCTVRLSRKSFPGLPSYSLGNLIRHFRIQVNDRHRAMADVMATVQLFERILDQEKSEQEIKQMVNLGIRESKLPKNLSIEKIHALPEDCGVYYLHDEQGRVVYVGKSINIRKRIAEHFADQTEKARKLQERVHDISYELTGSELLALLLESFEIKRLSPPVNRAQRMRNFPFVIHYYHNEAGYLCFEMARVAARERKKLQLVSEYPTMSRAKSRLEYIFREYELCARYCQLDSSRGPCFHFHLQQCRGACAHVESPEEYNLRAAEALERLSTIFEQDFFILDNGRHRDEYSVVHIQDGAYRGFGYIGQDDNLSVTMLRDAIKNYPSSPETTRIIQRYLHQNPKIKIIKCR